MKMSSKKKKNMKNVDFPKEIVEEILMRLPLKPLVRFKCVSKGWNASISDTNFAQKTQPELALRSQQYQLSVCGWDYMLRYYSFQHDKYFSENESEKLPHLYLGDGYDPIHFYGSYNGLWVLRKFYRPDIFLFNPVNKYFEKLFTDDRKKYNISENGVSSTCGLCYDSSTDDYKFVLATEFQQGFTVYNLRAKTWRRVRHEFDFSYEMCWRNNVVNLEERIYWLVAYGKGTDWCKLRSVKKIIFFDARTDMLSEVPIPEPKPGEGFRGILGLGVLDGRLAMTSRSDFCLEAKDNIEVWVMKEHGVKDSWTMLCTIAFDPQMSYKMIFPYDCLRIVEPFFLTEDGMLVLKVDHLTVTYNLKEKSYSQIYYTYLFAVPHLVTLKCFEHKVQAGTRAAAEGRSDWLEVLDN